jgi:hypothetical protein
LIPVALEDLEYLAYRPANVPLFNFDKQRRL